MARIISKVATWTAPNRKCEEVIAACREFLGCILLSKAEDEAFVRRIVSIARSADARYPRTRPLSVVPPPKGMPADIRVIIKGAVVPAPIVCFHFVEVTGAFYKGANRRHSKIAITFSEA